MIAESYSKRKGKPWAIYIEFKRLEKRVGGLWTMEDRSGCAENKKLRTYFLFSTGLVLFAVSDYVGFWDIVGKL